KNDGRDGLVRPGKQQGPGEPNRAVVKDDRFLPGSGPDHPDRWLLLLFRGEQRPASVEAEYQGRRRREDRERQWSHGFRLALGAAATCPRCGNQYPPVPLGSTIPAHRTSLAQEEPP